MSKSPHEPDEFRRTAVQEPVTGSGLQITGEYQEASRSDRLAEPAPEIAGYQIEGVLGRGGMGVVYHARQLAANRTVAVKMMLGGELAGERDRARLRMEAESIARLNHPNIVQIYEVGEYRGVPFFSMEFCAGGSLAHLLGGNPMRPSEAAKLVGKLADAIGYAHSVGVIHRDLKPANILLARGDGASGKADTRPQQSTKNSEGSSPSARRTSSSNKPDAEASAVGSELQPKVTDFGLAKHLDAGPGQTKSGQVMGTPSYMAPEQALGETRHVGPLADVYALGAILYECLTGRPPFKAATTLETLDQVRHREPVSIRDLAPAVPRDLETICFKCLQKDPHKRYSSGEALGDDLDRFLDNRPIVARPVGPIERAVKLVKRNKLVSAACAVACAALVTGTIVSAWYAVIAENRRNQAEENELHARSAEEVATTAAALAVQREGETKLALARESTALSAEKSAHARETRTAYVRGIALASLEYERNNLAAVRRLLDECPPELRGWEWHYLGRLCRTASWEIQAHGQGRTRVRFSADGSRMITAGEKHLVRAWDAKTRNNVADLPGHAGVPYALSAGPGSRHAVSGEFSALQKNSGQVMLWDLDKKVIAKVISGSGRWGAWVYTVAASPDGKHVAIGGEGGKIFIWDPLNEGEIKAFDVAPGNISCAAFTPDGAQLLVGTGRSVYVLDLHSGVIRVTLDQGAGDVQAIAPSPDGRRVAVGYDDGHVKLFDLETKLVVATLSGHTAMIQDVAFSPDGRHVASASADGSARVWDVSTGGLAFHLRGHVGAVTSVIFRPDGYELVTAGIDGTIRGWDLVLGNEPIHLDQQDLIVAMAGTPGRKRLAWACDASKGRSAAFHVMVHDFELGKLVFSLPNLPQRVRSLAFSKDGRQLALGYANGNVTVLDTDSQSPGATFATGIFAVNALEFSPDGAFLACGGGLPKGLLIDIKGKKLQTQFAGHTGSVLAITHRPDGKEIATGGYDGTVRLWNAETGLAGRTFRVPNGQVLTVAYHPDGKTLAAAGSDNKIRIWDLSNGEVLHTLEGHSGWVYQLLYSPDGSRLFSASADRSIRCWDPGQGLGLMQVAGTIGHQDLLAWVGGDAILASGAGGPVVRVWQKEPLPRERMLTEDVLVDWHNQAWSKAMLQRDWFAMNLHLDWLMPKFGDRHPGLYDQRGRARVGLGRVDDAIVDFTSAIDKGYADPRALMHRADAHVAKRDWAKAVADLDLFAKKLPQDAELLYKQAVLARFTTGKNEKALPAQRALRTVAVTAGNREHKVFSLWIDAVCPDLMADVEGRLAEARKAAETNSRQGFYRAVYSLWLFRAGRAEDAATEAQKAVELESKEGKTLAAAVLALACKKLGREEFGKMLRDELEPVRKRLQRTSASEWVEKADSSDWPTYLTFLVLMDEIDKLQSPPSPKSPSK